MASYSSQGLDHLGLVSGMCKEIGVAQIIDQATPTQAPDKHITFGKLVEAMILNGLGFKGLTLHIYPEYFEDKPVERLLGKGNKPSTLTMMPWAVVLTSCMKPAFQIFINACR